MNTIKNIILGIFKRREKKNKRYFLLLEVLIAFALIVLCAFPLLHPHVHLLKSEKDFLYQLEADRALDLVYVKVLEDLYHNRIPWKDMEARTTYALTPDQLIKWEIDHNLLSSLSLQGEYQLKTTEYTKEGDEPGQTYNLIEIALLLKPLAGIKKEFKATYKVFIERKLLIGDETTSKTPKQVKPNESI